MHHGFGFSVHANICIEARDRMRLERLIRYAARPAVATERLSALPDGRLLYGLKRPWRDGTSAVMFEPQDFMAKLAVPGAGATRSPYEVSRNTRPCCSVETADHPNRFNHRLSAQSRQRLVVKSDHVLRFGVSHFLQRDVEGERLVRVEARIDLLQLKKTFHCETGTYQQNQRQGDLRHEHHPPHLLA